MPAEVILEVDASTKFRRGVVLSKTMVGGSPDPDCDAERQKRCDRAKGHVLQVQHCGRIVCRECGAEWKDEGF